MLFLFLLLAPLRPVFADVIVYKMTGQRKAEYSYLIESKSINRAIVIKSDNSYIHLTYFDPSIMREYYTGEVEFPDKRKILEMLSSNGIPSAYPFFQNYLDIMNNSGGAFRFSSVSKFYRLDFVHSCRSCVFNNQIFDSYDFGNMLWGATMRWLGVSYLTAKVGSELNEVFGSCRGEPHWWGDSAKDQEAIRIGYFKMAPQVFKGLNRRKSIKENLQNLD